jgi:hypothetical protein
MEPSPIAGAGAGVSCGHCGQDDDGSWPATSWCAEKVEGRKSHTEARPDVVKLAKALARKKPKAGRLSLRAIAAELAVWGFLNERGRQFNPKSIAAILDS